METLTRIIFDCDGVLVDTERVMISVLLEMAATSIGFYPASTAVVEDSIAGVEAAVQGGFRVFAISTDANRHELAARGAITFGHMRELPALLGL